LLYDIISLLFYFKIPIIGYKWIHSNYQRNYKNQSYKEKKIKIDKKRKKDEEYMPKSNNMIINDETSQNNINDKSNIKNIWVLTKYEGKYNDSDNNSDIDNDIDNDLNRILKKIISILYDLFNNIIKKYKSQHN